MWTPRRANSSAMARPRPVAPPVTMATFPFISRDSTGCAFGRGATAEPEMRPLRPGSKYSGSLGSYGIGGPMMESGPTYRAAGITATGGVAITEAVRNLYAHAESPFVAGLDRSRGRRRRRIRHAGIAPRGDGERRVDGDRRRLHLCDRVPFLLAVHRHEDHGVGRSARDPSRTDQQRARLRADRSMGAVWAPLRRDRGRGAAGGPRPGRAVRLPARNHLA